ncbi:beta-lactamase family protein [Mycobacterium xenopi 4042]|uniref:Beta-lactamase family protein n=1 Tax=Mycobacterium xenopi 4042 TaxID=1299334 RepID=X8C2Y9_MYCXE|nr:beta-lactamase family protein [Mycobacterium xenopi 4042]
MMGRRSWRRRVSQRRGGLWSTADDYLRFAQMLLRDGTLDGVRVLSAESARRCAPIGSPPSRSSIPFGLAVLDWPRFGLNLSVVTDPAKSAPLLGRAGGYVQLPGAYGTWWQADPSRTSLCCTWFRISRRCRRTLRLLLPATRRAPNCKRYNRSSCVAPIARWGCRISLERVCGSLVPQHHVEKSLAAPGGPRVRSRTGQMQKPMPAAKVALARMSASSGSKPSSMKACRTAATPARRIRVLRPRPRLGARPFTHRALEHPMPRADHRGHHPRQPLPRRVVGDRVEKSAILVANRGPGVDQRPTVAFMSLKCQ